MYEIPTLVNEVFLFINIPCTFASVNLIAGKLLEKEYACHECGKGVFKHLFCALSLQFQ